ncbi:bifunctional hydroxymethylpyrimidine kinase/phosphomethylpyrimidine kinase [Ottowia testudinis]|uniref:hydroxymethylpyrimidine kinase n=1 Tax=Ottowia testudinis TaxID=2816950 RepID=A0A975CD91_9BURK|nr:bifunctional hydroxymethylpyrimidine kinase/phosphomethylpyrimidine kinase [Ottowia testudinis]QTD43737.1 bifunctional hydroxymethylpyrimidine kinase/phosphomethylpyrimidine kinase [Ottowia testudinis]
MKLLDHTQEYLRVLTIAGSDSGGGAGIQADLKTFAALGAYGMSALTALTAQNTLGVAGIHAMPPDFLAAQIDAVATDLGVHAVKVGMLHSPDIVHAVAQAIDRHALPHVVLDPVMVSATGATLIEPLAVQTLVAELFPRAVLITPNLDEAALLLGRPVTGASDMPAAAQALLQMGARAVLLKGGHLPGEQVLDVLVERGGEPHTMQHERVATRNLHGAGCTLSSALAVFLAQDLPLRLAAEAARSYVLDAIKEGAMVKTGQGVGPLNHGFSPRSTVLRQPSKPAATPT